MAFKNYNDFPPPKPVRLPIGDKTYEFPGVISARAWLLIHKMNARMAQIALAKVKGEVYDEDEEVLSDLEYIDVRREVFGETEEEMVADGLTSDCMQRAFYTLVAYHIGGQERAEVVWNQGEAVAPNRAARRATSTRSRGSHATSTTSKPARAGKPSSATGSS